MMPAAVLLAAAVVLQSPAPDAQPAAASAHISAIEVHGNHTTPDDVVVGIAGVKVGDPFTDQTLAAVKAASREERSVRGSGRAQALPVADGFLPPCSS